MAVAYHTFNDFNSAQDIIEGIRQSYDRPLKLADELLVRNVSEDGIVTRRLIDAIEPLPAKPPKPAGPPDRSERTEFPDWLEAGRLELGEWAGGYQHRQASLDPAGPSLPQPVCRIKRACCGH